MTKVFFIRGRHDHKIITARFIVDKGDAHIIRSHKWTLQIKESSANHGTRYITRPGVGKTTIPLAHEIARCGPNMEVRHINGDNLDFRRANLIAYKPNSGTCWRGHEYEGKVCKQCQLISHEKSYRKKKVEATANASAGQ